MKTRTMNRIDNQAKTSKSSRPGRGSSTRPKSNSSRKCASFKEDYYIKYKLGFHNLLTDINMMISSSRGKTRCRSRRYLNGKFVCEDEYYKWIPFNQAPKDSMHDFYRKENNTVILNIELEDSPFCFLYKDAPLLEDKNLIILESCHPEPAQKKNDSIKIACASLWARKAGIRPGMTFREAKDRCPEVIVSNCDIIKYFDIFCKFFKAIMELTNNVEAVNCDEAFVNVSHLINDKIRNDRDTLGHLIFALQKRIYRCTKGASAIIGVGSNRHLARLATRQAKRRMENHFHLQDKHVKALMSRLAIEELPLSMAAAKLIKLHYKIHTCGNIQKIDMSTLRNDFGIEMGEQISKLSFGEDSSDLRYPSLSTSVSFDVGKLCDLNLENSKHINEYLEKLTDDTVEILACNQKEATKFVMTIQFTFSDDEAKTQFNGTVSCLHGNSCSAMKESELYPSHNKDILLSNIIDLWRLFNVDPKLVTGVTLTCHCSSNNSEPFTPTPIRHTMLRKHLINNFRVNSGIREMKEEDEIAKQFHTYHNQRRNSSSNILTEPKSTHENPNILAKCKNYPDFLTLFKSQNPEIVPNSLKRNFKNVKSGSRHPKKAKTTASASSKRTTIVTKSKNPTRIITNRSPSERDTVDTPSDESPAAVEPSKFPKISATLHLAPTLSVPRLVQELTDPSHKSSQIPTQDLPQPPVPKILGRYNVFGMSCLG